MALQRKNTILEVSIESDALLQPDRFLNATYESESTCIKIQNVDNPEWAYRALLRVRNVKKVVDMGEAALDESTLLHCIKVTYDNDALDNKDAVVHSKNIEGFKQAVRNAISASGVGHSSHL